MEKDLLILVNDLSKRSGKPLSDELDAIFFQCSSLCHISTSHILYDTGIRRKWHLNRSHGSMQSWFGIFFCQIIFFRRLLSLKYMRRIVYIPIIHSCDMFMLWKDAHAVETTMRRMTSDIILGTQKRKKAVSWSWFFFCLGCYEWHFMWHARDHSYVSIKCNFEKWICLVYKYTWMEYVTFFSKEGADSLNANMLRRCGNFVIFDFLGMKILTSISDMLITGGWPRGIKTRVGVPHLFPPRKPEGIKVPAQT